MTEDEARTICRELGATLSIRQRKGKSYIFVSRWLPRQAAEAAGHQASSSSGQQFDRYVGPLDKLNQISPDTLRERIATLPLNPNKDKSKSAPARKPATFATSPAFHELLETIPTERTGILRWAKAATLTLKIPREQLSYRLAFYRDQLAAAGVHLAQSTRYRALFVPTLGSDTGGYFSHIWQEPGKSMQS
jgi:hypothetical protein